MCNQRLETDLLILSWMKADTCSLIIAIVRVRVCLRGGKDVEKEFYFYTTTTKGYKHVPVFNFTIIIRKICYLSLFARTFRKVCQPVLGKIKNAFKYFGKTIILSHNHPFTACGMRFVNTIKNQCNNNKEVLAYKRGGEVDRSVKYVLLYVSNKRDISPVLSPPS